MRSESSVLVSLALVVTVVIAAPVLLSPGTRLFGLELVGRHHDPFTVIQQFSNPVATGAYAQPVTDLTGAWLARWVDPVVAYNLLVLLTFPLAALAAYHLARHLSLAPASSGLVALAFAFSPFHLAQAAYHPHVAQVQWIPLYVLAMWRSLDQTSFGRLLMLVLAAVLVTFSNFYGGLIAGVLTPFVMATYGWFKLRGTPGAWRRVWWTGGTLAVLVAMGVGYLRATAPEVLTHTSGFAARRADLFVYSAKWWSYLVPPVANPWLGDTARTIWHAWDVREGVLEQQVSLGWGVVALGVVAIASRNRRTGAVGSWAVPTSCALATVALICSLSPERTIDGVRLVRPSAWLYDLVPMFRAYARFGVVVQLMAVLLAGIGVEWLWRSGRTALRVAAAALVGLAAVEYAVLPTHLWRDVLPTTAHRWVIDQSADARAFDCSPRNRESASVEWLTHERIQLAGDATSCLDPGLAGRLAGEGYAFLLVRRGARVYPVFSATPPQSGLRPATQLADGRVFEIDAEVPPIYTALVSGFSDREENTDWTWRWMGAAAAWTVVNTTDRPQLVVLTLPMQAFERRRHIRVRLDGRALEDVVVDPAREQQTLAPFAMPAGRHTLTFQSLEPPGVPDASRDGDRRQLSVALGEWHWSIVPTRP